MRSKLSLGFALVLIALLFFQPTAGRDRTITLSDALMLSAAGGSGTMTLDGLEGATARSNVRTVVWEIVGVPPDAGTGGGTGRATFEPVAITKAIDGNSLALAEAAVSGRHIRKVTIKTFRSGSTDVLVTYELADATVTAFQHRGAVESVEFAYRRITLTHGAQTFCWDLVAYTTC